MRTTEEPSGGDCAPLPFAVLNPGGRDRTQLFTNGAGSSADAGHPPVNYHGYAACAAGGFYRSAADIPETAKTVLLLLRRSGLHAALRALRTLRQGGKRVFVSWKESGLHQVAEALADARRHASFREICSGADGFLASTPELPALYRGAGCEHGEFIPTPYPVGEPGWDFSVPPGERTGIFIGTREFRVPSRNHLLAVTTACRLGVPVTVINPEGAAGRRLLRTISANIEVIDGVLPYPAYLRVMARHHVVFQLDRSAVPGQVAGDALLCGLPCVGGDGAVDRLAFPNLCGFGREPDALVRLLEGLLRDDGPYRKAVDASLRAAVQTVGFAVTRKRLGGL